MAEKNEQDTGIAVLRTEVQSLKELMLAQQDADERIRHAHEVAHTREHELTEINRKETKTELKEKLLDMNEFRNQLKDQAATFVQGETVRAWIAVVADRLDKVEDTLQLMRGERGGVDSTIKWIIAGVGLLSSLGLITGLISLLNK